MIERLISDKYPHHIHWPYSFFDGTIMEVTSVCYA